MIYPMFPFPVTLSDLSLDFKVTVIFRPIDALNVLCAQPTRGLFAIAKFLFIPGYDLLHSMSLIAVVFFCLHFYCRAMLYSIKRSLSRHVVCVSVCLSVKFVHSVKTNKLSSIFFHHRVATLFYQTAWQYSDGNPPTEYLALRSITSATWFV